MGARVPKSNWYAPQENPPRPPLELTAGHEICMWDTRDEGEGGDYKYTIAYWRHDKEGPFLHFVGDRPLAKEVNWKHLRELMVQGQARAQAEWDAKQNACPHCGALASPSRDGEK